MSSSQQHYQQQSQEDAHAKTQAQAQRQQRRLTINSEDRTVARSFSDELMDIFRIDNSVADLDQQVDSRFVVPLRAARAGPEILACRP